MSHQVHLIQSLQGHTEAAWTVTWNPERPLLASCSSDKTIRLYNYSNLKFTNVTSIDTGHKKTVRSIAWAPSGASLAAASFDSDVSIWEEEVQGTGDWECVASVEGHETECKCVAYSICSDGEHPKLATCSRDKTVWIWEAHSDAEFECMSVLMEHSQDVKYVAWNPKEEILASASYDDTIKLYIDDPSDDWYCFQTLQGHTSTVWSLAWSPCGKYLASSSSDKTIRIWRKSQDQLQWTCVSVIEGHERTVFSISWGPGKDVPITSLGWLASVGGDGVLKVREISEECRHHLIASLPEAHGVYDINSVSWCSRPGFQDMLATAGDDGIVNVWRIQ